ncbi:MAG: TetR/AcrR family transcriptional regulator, partial [Aridibacter sp.]
MDLTKTTENIVTRMAGDERRLQILQVAMKLFSKNGFAGTTTKKIAEAAGVSEATVFKHFSNKEELYADILDHKACNHGLENPFEEIAEEVAAKDDFGVFDGMALNAFKQHK